MMDQQVSWEEDAAYHLAPINFQTNANAIDTHIV